MATETAKFALELEDGISASSESAEDALKSLQAQIDRDSKALSQMKKAMREMQAGSSVDIDAYRKLKAEIDSTQNSIGKARAAFVNLGGDFSKVGRKTSAVKIAPKVDPPKGLSDMLSAVDALPGPLSKASRGISGVRAQIEGMAAAMGTVATAVAIVITVLAALVVTLTAVAVATAKATTELLRYAAAQADAYRAERLRLEGLGTLRRWMRLTGKDARTMTDSVDRVSSRVPLARSEVASLGQELHRLGIRGNAAEDALEALSIAQAVQGDLGRRRLMMLVRQAGHSERAMRDLSARVRKELGGNAAAQMRGLSMISTKLGESFRALFRGVNIAPLLEGLYRLTQMLSQNTQTGRALREILETILEPLIGELAGATPVLQRFFEELVIMALEFAIALTDVQIAIYRAFGTGILNRMLSAVRHSEALHVVLVAVGIVVATLAVGVAWLTLALIGALTPLMLVAWALYRGYQMVQRYSDVLLKLRVLFSPEAWSAAGRGMIDGLVAGVTSGADRLRQAVTGLATGAMSSFRTALGIHSPSTEFARLGLAIPQGITQGVERGASEATGAVGDVVSTTTSNVSQVRGGPSRAVTVGEIHIHVGGEGEGAEDTARRVTDALRDFFDTGMAAELA